MSIFHKEQPDANAMISITEEGKQAIDSDMVSNMRHYAILAELDQHSPQSLSSLAKSAKANIYVMKKEVDMLQKQGMVRQNSFRDN